MGGSRPAMFSFLSNPLWIFLQLTGIVLFVGSVVLSRHRLSPTMSRVPPGRGYKKGTLTRHAYVR